MPEPHEIPFGKFLGPSPSPAPSPEPASAPPSTSGADHSRRHLRGRPRSGYRTGIVAGTAAVGTAALLNEGVGGEFTREERMAKSQSNKPAGSGNKRSGRKALRQRIGKRSLQLNGSSFFTPAYSPPPFPQSSLKNSPSPYLITHRERESHVTPSVLQSVEEGRGRTTILGLGQNFVRNQKARNHTQNRRPEETIQPGKSGRPKRSLRTRWAQSETCRRHQPANVGYKR